MKKLTGIAVGDVCVKGVVACIPGHSVRTIPSYTLAATDIANEKKRLENAVEQARAALDSLIKNTAGTADRNSGTAVDVLKAQRVMLCDDSFMKSVYDELEHNLCNAESVLKKKIDEVITVMTAAGGTYFAERAVDISDAFEPVFSRLLAGQQSSVSRFSGISEGAIIAARTITPSEIFAVKALSPAGIVMEEGSAACHTAVIARAWDIPLLTGVENLMSEAKTGITAVLDCIHNTVVLEPNQTYLETLKSAGIPVRKPRSENTAELLSGVSTAVTKDGQQVYLNANVAFADEAGTLPVQSAAGIGLFRSEFLFLPAGVLPSEDTQYKIYKQLLETMGQKPVIIRTFDAGADKMLAEQIAETEKNGLLGKRGIRYFLDAPELFKMQLRALIRAGCYGNLYILVPMISCVEEIKTVKRLIAEAEAECLQKKQPYKPDIPLGIMIEVPSAAVCADVYAPFVDFFSIGTNDLVQYVMAANRENSAVAPLADYFQPSVLRLLAHTISAEPLLSSYRKEAGGKKPAFKGFVSICGEMAGQEEAVPLLLGMGLRHFSMNAQRLPIIKERIEKTDAGEAQTFFSQVRNVESAAAVRRAVQETFLC